MFLTKILLGYCLFVLSFCWLMQRAGRYFRNGQRRRAADRRRHDPTSRLI
jgi:hypothetical protein